MDWSLTQWLTIYPVSMLTVVETGSVCRLARHSAVRLNSLTVAAVGPFSRSQTDNRLQACTHRENRPRKEFLDRILRVSSFNSPIIALTVLSNDKCERMKICTF